ncbi:MAG: tRNA pseudouridine(55) synthase TruB [Methylococcaceae bacterium]|nr:tRNA pseudouridine(55) synthase TruB [Methylococcaceae bacterium]
MSRRNRGRKLDGILLLDKPSGVSSNQALQQVKKLFDAAKAGHTGSLDPLASGLLPVCFGQATRLAAYLLDSHKDYRVDIRLGLNTTTGDAEGEVRRQRPLPDLEPGELKAVLARFEGRISQLPPMHSALKRNGVRLYQYARQGIEVERSPRTVIISKLELLAATCERLTLQVSCSKGTYIRTLAEDIGEALGCGGYVETLRRTGVGRFRSDASWTIDDLQSLPPENREERCLLPIDEAVANWPKLEFAQDSVTCARHGRAIEVSDAPAQGWVRMYTQDSRFFGVGEILPDRRIAPRKLFLHSLEH